MTTFHNHRPLGESKQFDEGSAVYDAVADWQEYLEEKTNLQELLSTAGKPEATDDGDVYEIATPPGLAGDFAIVDMCNIKVGTPHKHANGEFDAVFLLEGLATQSMGLDVIELTPGQVVLIKPETPHFIISEQGCVFGALGWPRYDLKNQIPIDPTDPPEGFNTELYLSAVGSK